MLLLLSAALAAPLLHSHNDYLQDRPLEQALEAGFQSIEVDLWQRGGELVVAHYRWQDRGRLDALYLDPLQARVDALGSVHGDGEPLVLWLDLKQDDPELNRLLAGQLARYPMVGEQVQVVLTGNDGAKQRHLREYPTPGVSRDSNHLSPQDPPAAGSWTHYALSWKREVGRKRVDDRSREALAQTAQAAHAAGRVARIYGAPDTPESWRAQHQAGLDYIGTDQPSALAALLPPLRCGPTLPEAPARLSLRDHDYALIGQCGGLPVYRTPSTDSTFLDRAEAGLELILVTEESADPSTAQDSWPAPMGNLYFSVPCEGDAERARASISAAVAEWSETQVPELELAEGWSGLYGAHRATDGRFVSGLVVDTEQSACAIGVDLHLGASPEQYAALGAEAEHVSFATLTGRAYDVDEALWPILRSLIDPGDNGR